MKVVFLVIWAVLSVLVLLLLPLSLLPLHSAYQIWLAHNYTVEPYRRRRLLTELGQHILSGLQDLVGYMGPVLVLGALGVAMATFLLRLYLAMRR